MATSADKKHDTLIFLGFVTHDVSCRSVTGLSFRGKLRTRMSPSAFKVGRSTLYAWRPIDKES